MYYTADWKSGDNLSGASIIQKFPFWALKLNLLSFFFFFFFFYSFFIYLFFFFHTVFPAGIWRIFIQRCIASTLMQRCINVMYPLELLLLFQRNLDFFRRACVNVHLEDVTTGSFGVEIVDSSGLDVCAVCDTNNFSVSIRYVRTSYFYQLQRFGQKYLVFKTTFRNNWAKYCYASRHKQ